MAANRVSCAFHARSILGPHSYSKASTERVMPGGARLLSRLTDEGYSTIADMFSSSIGNTKSIGLDGNIKDWAIEYSKIDEVNRELGINLKEQINLSMQRNSLGQSDQTMVLDWGCGAGVALFQLGEMFKTDEVKLVGFGNTFYRKWFYDSTDITYIFDDAEHLDLYFKQQSIDVLFSYWGLLHYIGVAQDHLDLLSGLMKPNGFFSSNCAMGGSAHSINEMRNATSFRKHAPTIRKIDRDSFLIIPPYNNFSNAILPAKHNTLEYYHK